MLDLVATARSSAHTICHTVFTVREDCQKTASDPKHAEDFSHGRLLLVGRDALRRSAHTDLSRPWGSSAAAVAMPSELETGLNPFLLMDGVYSRKCALFSRKFNCNSIAIALADAVATACCPAARTSQSRVCPGAAQCQRARCSSGGARPERLPLPRARTLHAGDAWQPNAEDVLR